MSATKLDPIALPLDDRFPPCSVMVDGQAFDVSTNGRALVARFVSGCAFAAPATSTLTAGIVDMCRLPSTEPRRLPLAALLNAIGDPSPERDLPCKECSGSGASKDAEAGCPCVNCRCEECGGDGHYPQAPPMRNIFFAGFTVNANLVACALAALGITADEPELRVWADAKSMMLRIAGDGWLCVVIGCRLGSEERAKLARHFDEWASP